MSEDNNEDKELNPLEELEKALEEYEKRQRELTEATDEYLRKLKSKKPPIRQPLRRTASQRSLTIKSRRKV